MNGGTGYTNTMINMHKPKLSFHFPTVIGYIENPHFANRILPAIESILDDETNLTNAWNYKNTYDPKESLQLNELKDYIIKIAKNFLNDQGYDSEPLNLEPQIFASQMYEGDRHGRHCHPGSLLSGVYYLKVPEGSAEIMFYDPRPAKDILNIPRKESTEVNRTDIKIQPKQGTLLIWESWIHHEVLYNHSKDARTTVVFNI